jgi:lysophospholipase L1-like esterase
MHETSGVLRPAIVVMPLGDSATLGAYSATDFGIGGYRAPLWSRLTQEGYAIDFVGSVNGPAPAGVDPNHEGHGGWRIDDIAGSIDGWLANFKPDIILLMAGGNDIIQGYGVNTAATRMDTLLGKIFTDQPNAVVLLGSLWWVPTPNFYNYDIAQIQNLNGRLPALVAKYAQQGRAIQLVDQYNLGWVATDFGADQIHPAATGYGKMAQAWHDPLAVHLVTTPPPPPTTTKDVDIIVTHGAPTPPPTGAIAVHPDNSHYFLFRGQPTVLITSGEHYGAVLNLDFDYVTYLNTIQAAGLNMTRTFSGTYAETWDKYPGPDYVNGTMNTLNPAAGKFLTPWARSSTPGFSDGGNKFDLNQFDPVYWNRLRDFVQRASDRGIVVEYVLFCTTYGDSEWSVTPFNTANNVNGLVANRDEQWNLGNAAMMAVEDAFVRKAVNELNGFDNVTFEVVNEPEHGSYPGSQWQDHMAQVIANAESALPNRHLIAYCIGSGNPYAGGLIPIVSVYNVHYAYPPDAVATNYALNRPIAFDENGFRNDPSMNAYRQEAWAFLLNGGAVYDGLDWSFTLDSPNGLSATSPVPASGGGAQLRGWLGSLRSFMGSIDFVHMGRNPNVITAGVPGSAWALAGPDAVAVYLLGGGQANLVLSLPAGSWRAEWVDTRTASVVGTSTFNHGGGARTLASPNYNQDIALRVVRSATPAP